MLLEVVECLRHTLSYEDGRRIISLFRRFFEQMMQALGLPGDVSGLEIVLLLSSAPGSGAGGVIFILLGSWHAVFLLIVRTLREYGISFVRNANIVSFAR
jgi:hypothetical protein